MQIPARLADFASLACYHAVGVMNKTCGAEDLFISGIYSLPNGLKGQQMLAQGNALGHFQWAERYQSMKSGIFQVTKSLDKRILLASPLSPVM